MSLRALSLLTIFFAPALSAETIDDVIAEVEKVQKERATRTASIGVCLIPLAGEPSEAAGYQIDIGMIPASTMKAITTATALEILGSDYRFTTELQTAGKLDEDGTLTGDLIIRGGGDPTLGSSNIKATFAKWIPALREAGINHISGSVVGDASIFDSKRVADSWSWNDFGNYYGSGASGLTFHQNQFYCSFRTPRVGGRAPLAWTDPKLPEVEFINEMRVGPSGSGDQGYIYGAPYGKVFYLRGTVPAGNGSFKIRGALPEPAYFCARAFSQYLIDNGIPVDGAPTTLRSLLIEDESLAARKVIATFESDSLKSIMYPTNMKSNNLRAESMFRIIGHAKSKDGSIKTSSKAVRNHWANQGVDMAGYYMDDGSGLSRANTVSARQMAEILYHTAKSEEFSVFSNTLPVAGRSGTLRSIGGGSAAEGRIRAKSGTIDRVRNYAGYVTARSGKKYSFALFVNNYSGELWEVKSKIVRIWSKMVAL